MPAAIKVYDAARDAVFETETEEYIVGVVAAEMPSDFGTEALKAQAVAARSYMLYKMIHSPSSHRGGASVCTDHTCCKAYISYDDAVLRWSKEAADKVFATFRAAVEPVRGVILTYGGNVACALFHASSPGMTESAVNVWGGDLSYLRAVGTPETDEPETVFFKEAEFFGLLQAAGYAAAEGEVSVALNDTGRVGHVSVGDIKVPGTDMRNIFGLRSTCFTLDRTDGGYMFTVRGYGHGVGMSQRGAAEMAARGLSYDQILLHYYEGVTLCTVTISSQ